MVRWHIDLDLLLAVRAGQVPRRELRRRRRLHLDALCEGCGLRTGILHAFLRDAVHTEGAPRGRWYTAVANGSIDLEEAFAGDRAEVERDLATLRSVAASRRVRRVGNGVRSRFRSPLLIQALVDESRSRLQHDAHEALGWLAVARAVAVRAEAEVDSRIGYVPLRDLRLRIRAHEANARRVQGDLREADAVFADLRQGLDAGEPPAIAVSAELTSLEASLRYDQRRLPEAETLLERAAAFYRWACDAVGLAKVLVKRGMVLYIGGDPRRAITCYEAAAAVIDAAAEPRLALSAHHNLVLSLCAAGQAAAARDVLDGARELYRRLGDPTTANQLVWAEGKIAAALGDHPAAIESLRLARDRYAERGLEYDSSLVSLDLAEVHLLCGETAEVRSVAECLSRAFADLGVDREAARAVAIFCQAAVAEAVTLDVIARTRAALLHAGRPRPLPR